MQDWIPETTQGQQDEIPELAPQYPCTWRPLVERGRRVYLITRFVQRISFLLLIALLSSLAYTGISRYVVQGVEVSGQSMMPTLRNHEHYLLNRLVFRHQKPKVQDIVVLVDPDDQKLAVKRIVAVAGDSIQFKSGKVIVNGKQLAEPYLPENTPTFVSGKEQLIICGKNKYFVLGDNRMNSMDSRVFGTVPRDNILGRLAVN